MKEAQEDSVKKGVPTRFTKDGRPILESRQQRNAYLKAYGFFDQDAGYGDVQNGTFRENPSRDEQERMLKESY